MKNNKLKSNKTLAAQLPSHPAAIVLVTGANGMLGQDLCPILEDEGYEVIETDIHNLDITDEKQVFDFLSKEKPNFVVHCAAYTNVDKAEEDIETARLINAKGTENIAKACAEIDATMVYISTDYVFNGQGIRPYIPTDKPEPLNNYGLTKFEGEEAVKKYCKKYFIARTSWLYGIHGKNFVETMISLADKPELKVVDDQVGCPTWTVELANGIVKLLETEDYGIYHVCGSGSTSWYGFAREIFNNLTSPLEGTTDEQRADAKRRPVYGESVKREGGRRPGEGLKPCTTDEFPRPAKRPAYSIMDNNKICKNWKVALKSYLELRE